MIKINKVIDFLPYQNKLIQIHLTLTPIKKLRKKSNNLMKKIKMIVILAQKFNKTLKINQTFQIFNK